MMWNSLFGSPLQKKEEKWEDFFAKVYTKTGVPDETEPIIVEHLKRKDRVVYGARAINAQVPPEYKRPTEDWDIKTRSARQFVRKLESDLEELNVKDMFTVEQLPVRGEDFNVFRIVHKPTGKPLVDASVPKNLSLPPHVVIEEIKYKTLEAVKESKLEDVRNPEKNYRRQKDMRDLKRITRAQRESVSARERPLTRRRNVRPWKLLGEVRK